MTLPIKPSLYKYSDKWPKYIILHHTEELELNSGSVLFDKPTFQFNNLQKNYYQLDNLYLPYHFVIEKVGDEYHPIVSAPLLTKIEFLDLDTEYQEGVHIALLGNYNADNVDLKLYDVLTLRVIIPLMKTFRIEEKNILFHSEVSFLRNSTCPGEFFSRPKLISSIRTNMKRKSVSRS